MEKREKTNKKSQTQSLTEINTWSFGSHTAMHSTVSQSKEKDHLEDLSILNISQEEVKLQK